VIAVLTHQPQRPARRAELSGPEEPCIRAERLAGGAGTDAERIAQAYRAVRRENAARYALARPNREGRGTGVEIHPLNQSQVFHSPSARGGVPHVERAALASDRTGMDGDDQELDDAWVDQIVDVARSGGQYEYGMIVGFAA
jgi:hypothetical protein